MVMSMLAGCGKADSTYFKELKEMSKITTGRQNIEMNLLYKGEDTEDIPELLKNTDGMAITIKIETIIESEKKAGLKLFAKLGSEADFTEVMTAVVDDNILYLTLDKLMDFVAAIDASMAEEMETNLAQMGISGAISVDFKKVLEAVGTEYPEVTEDMKKSSLELNNKLFETLEKNYSALVSVENGEYILKVDKDTIDKAISGTIDFLNNDAEELIKKFNELAKGIYGEDNALTGSVTETYDEITNQIPDIVKELEENRDDIVKTVKEEEISVISKVANKKGESKLTVNGEIKDEEEEEAEFGVNYTIKNEKAEVKEYIPEDASDITTLLVTLLNQLSAEFGGDMPTDTMPIE